MERLKLVAILMLLAALAGSIALAAANSEAEVRISARQVEDGRVEFALQQRVDGEWGERIRPRSRYFPTDATINRWLNSTPISVRGADDPAGGPTTSATSQRSGTGESAEVRITARRLASGRIEFGLQQRMGEGWSDRILPPSRYFPAAVGHNRWLNSTPMMVSMTDAGGLTEEPAASVTPQTSDIRTQVGAGVTPGGALWSVGLDDSTDARQAWLTSPTESSSSIYEPRLVLGCTENGARLAAFFDGLPVSDSNDRYTATIRWDSLTAQTMSLDENTDQGHFLDNPTVYRRNVANHDTLRVQFTGSSDTVTATIDVSAMRDAPTWPNILACDN